jgi:hypothetical protein
LQWHINNPVFGIAKDEWIAIAKYGKWDFCNGELMMRGFDAEMPEIRSAENKKARYMNGLFNMAHSGGFEPPTTLSS